MFRTIFQVFEFEWRRSLTVGRMSLWFLLALIPVVLVGLVQWNRKQHSRRSADPHHIRACSTGFLHAGLALVGDTCHPVRNGGPDMDLYHDASAGTVGRAVR